MPSTICLVRHGEAASSWDQDPDPGLSEKGRVQARKIADQMQSEKAVRLVSSPLKRAQETSAPLAELWQRQINIAPQIAEIPSHHIPFEERRAWLNEVMQKAWRDQSDTLKNWRQTILDFVSGLDEDAVLFSHFMVINAIVGAVEDDDNVMIFRPDNCSVTRISVHDGRLSLIERGHEAITVVR